MTIVPKHCRIPVFLPPPKAGRIREIFSTVLQPKTSRARDINAQRLARGDGTAQKRLI
jgi:hypothetical protein